jgi:hypothetical protein
MVGTELMPHQKDLADSALTYHYQLWAAEMGVGKTLAAQKVIEKSASSIGGGSDRSRRSQTSSASSSGGASLQRDIKIEFLTYEGLTDRIDEWKPATILPQGVIFDESSRLKGPPATHAGFSKAGRHDPRQVRI